jgi:hypothetical protein
MAIPYPWKARIDALTPEQKQKLHDRLERKERRTVDEINQLLYLKGYNDGNVSALEELLRRDSEATLLTSYNKPSRTRKNS